MPGPVAACQEPPQACRSRSHGHRAKVDEQDQQGAGPQDADRPLVRRASGPLFPAAFGSRGSRSPGCLPRNNAPPRPASSQRTRGSPDDPIPGCHPRYAQWGKAVAVIPACLLRIGFQALSAARQYGARSARARPRSCARIGCLELLLESGEYPPGWPRSGRDGAR